MLRKRLERLERAVQQRSLCPHCKGRWVDLVVCSPGEPEPPGSGCPVCGGIAQRIVFEVLPPSPPRGLGETP